MIIFHGNPMTLHPKIGSHDPSTPRLTPMHALTTHLPLLTLSYLMMPTPTHLVTLPSFSKPICTLRVFALGALLSCLYCEQCYIKLEIRYDAITLAYIVACR